MDNGYVNMWYVEPKNLRSGKQNETVRSRRVTRYPFRHVSIGVARTLGGTRTHNLNLSTIQSSYGNEIMFYK